MKALRLFSLIIALALLGVLAVVTLAEEQTLQTNGGCTSTAGYDPACDVDHNGVIDVNDIQLTAGHWNETGEWSDHKHLGQTWVGINTPLILSGTFQGWPDSAAPLIVHNLAEAGGAGLAVWEAPFGLFVEQATKDGIQIATAGDDGVMIQTAGNPTTYTYSSEHNAFEVGGAGGHGLFVGQADLDGVHVDSAGNHGVFVGKAGSASTTYPSTYKNGFEVAGAQDNGLYVGHADGNGVRVNSARNDGVLVQSVGGYGVAVGQAVNDGVYVYEAGVNGVYVYEAGLSGVTVQSAGDNGVTVYSAGDNGLEVWGAGNDGVFVSQVGAPSSHNSSLEKNGFEVAGAESHGLYVGRADLDGVHVNSAGGIGVEVYSAEGDGYHVTSAGGDGLDVSSAGNVGVWVANANQDGLYVGWAGHDGLRILSASDDGVDVGQAGDTGVYANTYQVNGEWGFYTPDKIHGSNITLSSVTITAKVTGNQALTPGDVVAAEGVSGPLPDSNVPLALVQPANTGSSVIGVAEGRMALTPKLQHEGEEEQEPVLRLRSTDGPAQPGDYVALTVLGVAQVKVDASADIQPGQRLTASDVAGHARSLKTVEVEGVRLAEDAPTIGIALAAPEPGKDTIPVFVTLR